MRVNGTAMRRRPLSHNVGKSIMQNCRAGRWQSVSQMAARAGVTEDEVHSVLETMCWRPAYGAKAEWKRVGKQKHYRIFKQDKTVSVDELAEKLTPIIDGLIAEGKKNMATMVPATVAMLAAKLKRLLDEWAE